MRARTLAALACTGAAVVLAGAGGCSKADLSDEAFVNSLRIIGAQAEPPEAAPGDTVMLQAWTWAPNGAAVDVSWSACLLPSDGLANAGCTDGSGNGVLALGSGLTISMVVPELTRAQLGPPDATDGVFLPIVMHATSGGDSVDAVYRLRIAGDQMRNENPMLSFIDGIPDDPEPTREGQMWTLIARYGGKSVEQYLLESTGMKIFERLTTQWFASAGTFPDQPVGGTAVQELTIDRALPPKGGTFELWVVGHDERGGTTMLHHTFVMQ